MVFFTGSVRQETNREETCSAATGRREYGRPRPQQCSEQEAFSQFPASVAFESCCARGRAHSVQRGRTSERAWDFLRSAAMIDDSAVRMAAERAGKVRVIEPSITEMGELFARRLKSCCFSNSGTCKASVMVCGCALLLSTTTTPESAPSRLKAQVSLSDLSWMSLPWRKGSSSRRRARSFLTCEWTRSSSVVRPDC